MDLGHEHFFKFTNFLSRRGIENYFSSLFAYFYSIIDEPLNIDKDIFDNLFSDLGFGSKIFFCCFLSIFSPLDDKMLRIQQIQI